MSNFSVRSFSAVREAPISDGKSSVNEAKVVSVFFRNYLKFLNDQPVSHKAVSSTSLAVIPVQPNPIPSTAIPEPTTASNAQPIALVHPKPVDASGKLITIATSSGPLTIFVQGKCPTPLHSASNIAPCSAPRMKLIKADIESKSISHISWSLDTRVRISEYWIFVKLPGRPDAASGTWNFIKTVPAVANQFSMSTDVNFSSYMHGSKSIDDLKIIVAASTFRTPTEETSQL